MTKPTYPSWVCFIATIGNMIEYIAVLSILFIAFYFQIVMNELPCPLCLLQRAGMMGIIFGFLLNFRFGYYPSHYAIVILSALFTAFVAMRQIALHVVPGTGAYGSAFLGYHLYTWAFIVSMTVAVSTVLLFSLDKQYHQMKLHPILSKMAMKIFFLLAAIIIALNIASVVMECGLSACPDNPVRYEIMSA